MTTHFEHPEILKQNVHDLCIDYLSVGINPEITYFHPVNGSTNCRIDGILLHVCHGQCLVRRFNSLYKPVLKEPDTLLGSCPRLIGLDGNAKMSKSMGNAIFLSDDEETTLSKVKTAVTDPARITLKDKGNPEVCIVNEYHKVFNSGEYNNICSMCCNAAIGCTTCKKRLAEVLNTLLSPIRAKRRALEEKPEYIREIIQHGSEKSRIEGAKTLEKVKEAMSIKYF